MTDFLIGIVVGFAVCAFFSSRLSFAVSTGTVAHDKAMAVLQRHGLSPRMYLAAGVAKGDRELQDAIRLFATGYLIVDRDEQLVGTITEAIVPHQNAAVVNLAEFKRNGGAS